MDQQRRSITLRLSTRSHFLKILPSPNGKTNLPSACMGEPSPLISIISLRQRARKTSIPIWISFNRTWIWQWILYEGYNHDIISLMAILTNSDDPENERNEMIPRKKMIYPLLHVVEDNYKVKT
jgi:hypothetical protein